MRKDIPGIATYDTSMRVGRQIVPITIRDNIGLFGKNFKPTRLPKVGSAGYGIRPGGEIRMLEGFAQAGYHVTLVDLPLDHKALHRDSILVTQVAREGLHVAADAIRAEYRMDGPVDAFGHSKGASVLYRAMDENHEGIGMAAGIQSGELLRRTQIKAGKLKKRVLAWQFEGDMVMSALHQENTLDEVRAGGAVLVTFVHDVSTRRLPSMVIPVVVGSQGEPVFEHVRRGKMVQITATSGDGVFSSADTKKTLMEIAVDSPQTVPEGGRLLYYEVPKMPHLNGSARQGMSLLIGALDNMENPENSAYPAVQLYPTLIAA